MVVGDHQAIRRNERSRAARQGHDRAHRALGQIGQACGGDGDAGALQFGLQLRQLPGLPLALVGMGEDGAAHRRDCEREGRDDRFQQGGFQ
jgi:hypothetical protein